MCRLSRNSGSLNLLEPSGPLEACNWINFANVMFLVRALCSHSDTYFLSGRNIRYISAPCFQIPSSTSKSPPNMVNFEKILNDLFFYISSINCDYVI